MNTTEPGPRDFATYPVYRQAYTELVLVENFR